MKVLVESGVNPQIRRFNVERELSELPRFFTEVPLTAWVYLELEATGPFGAKLINLLAKIEGVTRLELGRYHVDVSINPVFEWDDIERDILNVIRHLVGEELEVSFDDSAKAAAELRSGLFTLFMRSLVEDEPSEDDEKPESPAWGGMDC